MSTLFYRRHPKKIKINNKQEKGNFLNNQRNQIPIFDKKKGKR
jgi:hypothetical protein